MMNLNKKEKIIMLYLYEKCTEKKSQLVSAEKIIERVSENKLLITQNELDEIMLYLLKDEYIDYIVTDNKKETFYCVTLKNKGCLFKKDLIKEKQKATYLILRTVALAVLSFIIGLLLKTIF